MVATPPETGVAAQPVSRSRGIPGEPGLWLFVLLDMSVFAYMFGIFAWYRAGNGELFRTSQNAVNPWYGLIYTLLLLSSSWCVVIAVGAARKRTIELSSNLARCAMALGAAFVVIKFVEYIGKFSAGITPLTNSFFQFYFILTFLHLLHACTGVGLLAFMRNQIHGLAEVPVGHDGERMRTIECCAVYWHMVDLLWIFLFALFYLRG